MPKFENHRPVRHSPENMFALVADVEKYPQFLPLCDGLTVRSRKERDGNISRARSSISTIAGPFHPPRKDAL